MLSLGLFALLVPVIGFLFFFVVIVPAIGFFVNWLIPDPPAKRPPENR